MKQSARTLQQLRQDMITQQAARERLINKGRACFRLGIDLQHNPEKDLSARGLWETGWQRAASAFKHESLPPGCLLNPRY